MERLLLIPGFQSGLAFTFLLIDLKRMSFCGSKANLSPLDDIHALQRPLVMTESP